MKSRLHTPRFLLLLLLSLRETGGDECATAWHQWTRSCGTVVFRHIPKTGGTTIGMAIGSQFRGVCAESWETPGVYSGLKALEVVFGAFERGRPLRRGQLAKAEWVARANASFRKNLRASRDRLLSRPCKRERTDDRGSFGDGAFPKMLVESHGEMKTYERYLTRRAALLLAWPRCRFRVFAIVREPIAQKISSWSYFKEEVQRHPTFGRWARSCAIMAQNISELDARRGWAPLCLQQVEFVFPQLRPLLRASTLPLVASTSAGFSDPGAEFAAREAAARVATGRVRSRVMRELLDGAIIIGTFEQFAESLLRVAHAWGLPLLASALVMASHRNVVEAGSRTLSYRQGAWLEVGRDAELQPMLQRLYHLDTWLHAHATERVNLFADSPLPSLPSAPFTKAPSSRRPLPAARRAATEEPRADAAQCVHALGSAETTPRQLTAALRAELRELASVGSRPKTKQHAAADGVQLPKEESVERMINRRLRDGVQYLGPAVRYVLEQHEVMCKIAAREPRCDEVGTAP